MKSLYESILSSTGTGKNSLFIKAKIIKELIETVFGNGCYYNKEYEKYTFKKDNSRNLRKNIKNFISSLQDKFPDKTEIEVDSSNSMFTDSTCYWEITGIKCNNGDDQTITIMLDTIRGNCFGSIYFSPLLREEIARL